MLCCNSPAFVEVPAGNHQLSAKRLHCGIFLSGVAFRNDDNARQAISNGGDCDGLPVIAACRGNQAVWQAAMAAQGIDIDQTATRLE